MARECNTALGKAGEHRLPSLWVTALITALCRAEQLQIEQKKRRPKKIQPSDTPYIHKGEEIEKANLHLLLQPLLCSLKYRQHLHAICSS